MDLWFLRMWKKFADKGAWKGKVERWRSVGLACSRLFVLEEIKGVFKDLVTTGNQFGLETNESTPKIYIYIYIYIYIFFFWGAATQRGSWPPHSWCFLDHTQRRTTVGRTPLDEWSARPRDLYLTTHNNHNRQTPMPLVGFEPTISAGERPQTYALDRAATGTG